MNKISLRARATRGVFMTAVTVLLVAILSVGNVALAYLGQTRMLFTDLTPEGLYTLSDGMVKECSFVDGLTEREENGNIKKIEILFCTDPDNLLASQVTRVPYYMALALGNKFENIEVNTVNVALNPGAVAEYKTTSLSKIKPSDIIVSYGGVYRIAGVESFWGVNSEDVFVSYNGEYRMASILKSLTAVERPSVCFVTNHGEEYYDSEQPTSAMSQKLVGFYDLLVQRGFEVKTLNLITEDIPDDCVLLVINNPVSDFGGGSLDSLYDFTETDKIDEYLTAKAGAIFVTKDPGVKLPNLEQLMLEWGIEFADGIVKDDPTLGGALAGANVSSGLSTDIIGKYVTDENSYAFAVYEEYASLSSAPRFVISNTGFVKCSFGESTSRNEDGSFRARREYSTFLKTGLTARAYEDGLLASAKGVKDLVAVTTRAELDGYTGTYTYSYVAAAHSADFLSTELITNGSYANYDIVSALINNISRVDEYASISLGGISQNSSSYGGKMLRSEAMSELSSEVYSADFMEVVKVNRGISVAEIAVYTVISMIAPVAALIVGIVVRVKRKFL